MPAAPQLPPAALPVPPPCAACSVPLGSCTASALPRPWARDPGVCRREHGLLAWAAAPGCLRIGDHHGHPFPRPQPAPAGWGVEETPDVGMVSAACPPCKILVDEASTASFANLGAA